MIPLLLAALLVLVPAPALAMSITGLQQLNCPALGQLVLLVGACNPEGNLQAAGLPVVPQSVVLQRAAILNGQVVTVIATPLAGIQAPEMGLGWNVFLQGPCCATPTPLALVVSVLDLDGAILDSAVIGFDLFMPPVATPEPTTLLLLGGTLAAIGLLLRRRHAI